MMTILRTKPAVIFDIDGTLVDTREMHLAAWRQVLTEFGVPAARARLEALFGQHSDEWVRELLLPERQGEGRAIVARKNDLFRSRLNDLRPFPGARELLRALKEAGKLLAFATGATKEELAHHLRLLDAEDLADATAYDREVQRGKPAPDIYRLAGQRLGTSPADTVAVGDSLYDVEAAEAVSMDCVALLTGGFAEEALRSAGATEVYPAIADLYEAFMNAAG
jgi:HAD superfamily hydrolase (TIGR01509 family)